MLIKCLDVFSSTTCWRGQRQQCCFCSSVFSVGALLNVVDAMSSSPPFETKKLTVETTNKNNDDDNMAVG